MICLIAAHSKNFVIGKNGRIPWNLREDQLRFKELTTGGIVIMGRKTFEEIFKKFGRGLPERETIVVSKNHDYKGEQLFTSRSLDEAVFLAKNKFPQKNIFICGGESIYKEALQKNLAEKIYITLIYQDFEGDAFFPNFNSSDFYIEENKKNENPIPFEYITYCKKSI